MAQARFPWQVRKDVFQVEQFCLEGSFALISLRDAPIPLFPFKAGNDGMILQLCSLSKQHAHRYGASSILSVTRLKPDTDPCPQKDSDAGENLYVCALALRLRWPRRERQTRLECTSKKVWSGGDNAFCGCKHIFKISQAADRCSAIEGIVCNMYL